MKETNTTPQQLAPLIEWWLGDKEVGLTYSFNERGKGSISPEFDAVLWLEKRKVHLKALAMMWQSDFMTRGHRYTLAQVYSGLVAFIWKHYVATQPYPEWLTVKGVVELKRPR